MDTNSLLTIFSILIAVYALLDKSQKLRLKFNFRTLDVLILSIAFILIHLLIFFNLDLVCNSTLVEKLDPDLASYSIFLLSGIWVFVRLNNLKLPPSKIFSFEELIKQLLSEKKYQQALDLLEDFIEDVNRIYNWDYFFRRHQKALKDNYPLRLGHVFSKEGLAESTNTTNREKFKNWIIKTVSTFIPTFEEKSDSAGIILRIITNNQPLISKIVSTKPYLGLKFFEVESFYRKEFFTKYFSELYKQDNSILFSELRNNQNTSGFSYAIESENKLLVKLFSEEMLSEKIGVWFPLGEEVIKELNQRYLETEDEYNLDMGDFYDRGKFESRLYMIIFFFNLMVTKALQHNVTWHMWLSYYTNFTELICQNINPNPNTYERDAEFPTRYHYLLYELINKQCGWIRAIESLPEDQNNIQLQSPAITHENGNIPKAAIMSLVNTLYNIIKSDNIEERFKCYIAGVVFRNYLELTATTEHPRYVELFRSAIAQGGWFERNDANIFRTRLLHYLRNNFDRIPHNPDDIEELEDALRG